jgi:hypothetical protein
VSRNNPIPVRLRSAFVAHMVSHDFEQMSDGAWFATLETAAREFIDKHRLKFACGNSAAHQYLRIVSPSNRSLATTQEPSHE